jgi:hypothetical protein
VTSQVTASSDDWDWGTEEVGPKNRTAWGAIVVVEALS